VKVFSCATAWQHLETLLFRITNLGFAQAVNLKGYKTGAVCSRGNSERRRHYRAPVLHQDGTTPTSAGRERTSFIGLRTGLSWRRGAHRAQRCRGPGSRRNLFREPRRDGSRDARGNWRSAFETAPRAWSMSDPRTNVVSGTCPGGDQRFAGSPGKLPLLNVPPTARSWLTAAGHLACCPSSSPPSSWTAASASTAFSTDISSGGGWPEGRSEPGRRTGLPNSLVPHAAEPCTVAA
jgi:hypothetical protein